MITISSINRHYDILPEETIKELKSLSTGLLSDAMSGLGAMNYRIKPIDSNMKFVGTAFTVNLKNGTGPAVMAAVALAGQGYVIVINSNGNSSNAVFGSLIAKTAIKRGIEGVVLDGLVRDTAELKELGLPVFSLGAIPCAAEKEGPIEINVPVSCGGIAVIPGDIVVGDEDGVVVVPRNKVDAVIAAAKAKLNLEIKRMQDIENGLLMPSWLEEKIGEIEFEK
jgi:4-hydroxy-4-methyl-2-oxoglutarate aldolase